MCKVVTTTEWYCGAHEQDALWHHRACCLIQGWDMNFGLRRSTKRVSWLTDLHPQLLNVKLLSKRGLILVLITLSWAHLLVLHLWDRKLEARTRNCVFCLICVALICSARAHPQLLNENFSWILLENQWFRLKMNLKSWPNYGSRYSIGSNMQIFCDCTLSCARLLKQNCFGHIGICVA